MSPWTIPGSLRLAVGGRNSLLESAQEATLMSVPTPQPSVNPCAGCGGLNAVVFSARRFTFLYPRLEAEIHAPAAQYPHRGTGGLRNLQRRGQPTVGHTAITADSGIRFAGISSESHLYCFERSRPDGSFLMDHLWSPWRFTYVTTADTAVRPGVPEVLAAWPGDLGCVFCNLIAAIDFAIANGMSIDQAEAAGGLVHRGEKCFICLNAFPYTSGHVMVMPYAHLDRLAALPAEAAHELMDLAQRTELALERVYSPHGYNFGLNVGKAAGAGVQGHLHLHAMPRWAGDTNFMTTVGETRVLPEDLETTWRRLREAFGELEV